MRYTVLGVFKTGPLVNGYSIQDEDGKILKVKYSDFKELVKASLVDNFKVIKIEDIEYVIPKGRVVSELMDLGKTECKIEDRIFNAEDKVIGYKVRTDSGDMLKISIKKAWELAVNGSITNADAYYREANDSIEKLLILTE